MPKTKAKSSKGKSAGKAAKTSPKVVTAPSAPKTRARPSKAPSAPKTQARPSKAPSAPKTQARPSKAPSLPLPPPPPAPPPVRDELAAPRDIARLLRYGERFGAHKIDVRMLPLQLPVSSGALAVFDPAAPKSWRVFDRPAGSGQFRVMLSVAKDESGKERLAAIVIHIGRPPIAKWTVAHYRGQKKPKSPDALPRVEVASGAVALIDAGDGSPGVVDTGAFDGVAPIDVPLTDGRHALLLASGNGAFAAYWAVDATDKPICLVVDFDVFTQKEWKTKPT